ncbi:MAG: hypothetical protein HQ523_13250 [Lentisphaerae bacterium]|nr:hypothetical protein [Lentisphaerota bacterium]
MSVMNIGVIGCGALAKATHLKHVQQDEDANLKWVCDINEENLKATQMIFGAEQATTEYHDDMRSWKSWTLEAGALATGPMLFEMTHFTDITNWFAGVTPVSVSAAGHLAANQSVTITYEDGSIATIIMAATGTFGYPKELYEFYANGAGVILDHFVEVRTGGLPEQPLRSMFSNTSGRPYEGIETYRDERKALEEEAAREGHDGMWILDNEIPVDKGHRQHLKAFRDAVRGNGPSPCGLEDTMLATRVAFAAIESLKQNQPVEV